MVAEHHPDAHPMKPTEKARLVSLLTRDALTAAKIAAQTTAHPML
jgi:hypothetical protein